MSHALARSAMRWLMVKNTDTEPAPPYALLHISGLDSSGNFTVTRPVRNGEDGLLVNGPLMIPAGAYGQAHQAWPAIVAYDEGSDDTVDAPATGETWGSIAPVAGKNAWKLHYGYPGFVIAGGADSGRVNAIARPARRFLARLTTVTTLASADVAAGAAYEGMTVGTNVYGFVEQSYDPQSGLPVDATGGVSSGTPNMANSTGSFAQEIGNNLLTIPGPTPPGYANPGPYVEMLYRGAINGVNLYEFSDPAPTLNYHFAGSTGTTLSTSWADTTLSVTLAAGSKWLLIATLNGSLTASASGAGDSLSFRFNDPVNGAGTGIECCNALCASTTFVDSCTLVEIVSVSGASLTVTVQGIINSASGSTGSLMGNSTTHGNYLAAIQIG